MAFKISEAVFRTEVRRRLLSTDSVRSLIGVKHRQAVWKRVDAGTLPPPLINQERGFALWDADEIASHASTKK